MATDPYTPPKDSLVGEQFPYPIHCGSRITAVVILWVLWLFLALSLPFDLTVGIYSGENIETSTPPWKFVMPLGLIALFQIALIAGLIWFVFHYLINPKRLCPGRWWASIAAILGGGMILALAKSIEIYGLILFFQSRDWSYYLPFFITSAVVLIVLIPTLLLRVPKPDIGLSAKSK